MIEGQPLPFENYALMYEELPPRSQPQESRDLTPLSAVIRCITALPASLFYHCIAETLPVNASITGYPVTTCITG